MFGSSPMLGLALSDTGVVCAEVAVARGRPVVRRVATFTTDVSREDPVAYGRALGAFLKERKFGASRAAVGVPARWVVATERDVPPADDEQTHAILRMHADRMTAGEGGELVTDYAGTPDRRTGGRVLLVGMMRKQLDRVMRTVEAADLTVVAVAPTTMALAAVAGDASSSGPMLVLGRGGAELMLRDHGTPRMLRHITLAPGDAGGGGGASVAALGPELRRAVALASGRAISNGAANGAAPRLLELWDTVGLSPEQLDDLGGRIGMPVKPGSSKALADSDSSDADGAAYAPATALAVGAARRTLPVDFAHSRLAVRPPARVGRRTLWGGLVGGAVVVGLVSIYVDNVRRTSELADLTTQLAVIAPDVKAAEETIARFTYARGYFDARPPVLTCLREATLAFGADEPIWVTNFTLRDGRVGQLAGKAADQRTVLTVLERLKRNAAFGDVKLIDMREAGARTKDVAFSVGFTFNAAPSATPVVAPAGNAKGATR